MKENLKLIIKNTYSPYSKFGVACIVKMKSGQEFIGVNVENASYKNGLCAEQVAIAAAIAEGFNKKDFSELHVMGSPKAIIHPCFLCRQLLVEFFSDEDLVVCYNSNGKSREFTVAELCPHPFELEEM